MALFGSKKKKDVVTEKPAKPVKPAVRAKREAVKAEIAKPAVVPSNIFTYNVGDIIICPHITEKSGTLSQNGVYTFQVTGNANKNTIAKAINSLYRVTPTRVAVVNLPAKQVFIRGRRGRVPGVRKAVVTLKKGDKIDFI